ncbi:MAG: DUF4215 domain-containing protein [Deltaproteobacteria bacterium]|nr:DUF4215 domain-containing protein [Deltaproteobacteria bacterium]
MCTDVNRATHRDPRNACREVSCTENDDGVLDEELVALANGTNCVLSDDDEGLGICREGICIIAGCGNGFVEPGEDCDVVRDENDIEERSAGCRIDCSLPTCGDGIVDVGSLEVDGNLVEFFEECDEANAGPEDPRSRRCLPDCTWNRCGDANILSSGIPEDEPCDDGNSNTNDGCYIQYCSVDANECSDVLGENVECISAFSENGDCHLLKMCVEAYCGDGIVNQDVTSPLFERCDDANENPNDGCHECRRREWDEDVVIGHAQARGNSLEWELSQVPIALSVDNNGDLLVAAPAESLVVRVHMPPDIGSVAFCQRVDDEALNEEPDFAAVFTEKPKISLVAGKTLGDRGDEGPAVDALLFLLFPSTTTALEIWSSSIARSTRFAPSTREAKFMRSLARARARQPSALAQHCRRQPIILYKRVLQATETSTSQNSRALDAFASFARLTGLLKRSSATSTPTFFWNANRRYKKAEHSVCTLRATARAFVNVDQAAQIYTI